MATTPHRAVRVLLGSAAMLAFVAVLLLVLAQRAGHWGVPYFSFTSANGSPCTNDLVGYTCDPLTLADVEFFGDLDLPDGTVVLAGRYRSTHDYRLDAQLAIPPASAAPALAELHASFGPCRKGVQTPLSTAGLRRTCAMVSDDGVEESGVPASRLYSVGTGLRDDGSRLVGLAVRSR